MINNLRGKGLFIFSDPGGAKPILALIESIQSSLVSCNVFSDRDYSFYQNFSVEVNMLDKHPIEIIKLLNPDFVFTGTSYTSKIELEFIRAAKELLIETYSFIDHWTFIRERFNNNGVEIFPNHILVIDEEAKLLAIQNGINEERLSILKNPYHLYLRNWRPRMMKEELLELIGVGQTDKKIILYAPDPLSNLDGINVFGFDEIIATKELNRFAEENYNELIFLVNPHPNQNVELLKTVLSSNAILVPPGTDVNTLIYFSDIVLGFFSNILIEASIMGKKVLRYFPAKAIKDPMSNKSIGKIVNIKDLLYNINSN